MLGVVDARLYVLVVHETLERARLAKRKVGARDDSTSDATTLELVKRLKKQRQTKTHLPREANGASQAGETIRRRPRLRCCRRVPAYIRHETECSSPESRRIARREARPSAPQRLRSYREHSLRCYKRLARYHRVCPGYTLLQAYRSVRFGMHPGYANEVARAAVSALIGANSSR